MKGKKNHKNKKMAENQLCQNVNKNEQVHISLTITRSCIIYNQLRKLLVTNIFEENWMTFQTQQVNFNANRKKILWTWTVCC